MNNERYNPNLCHYLRNNKPPPGYYEFKENDRVSYFRRDGYTLNSTNARWGYENNRKKFAELNDIRK